MFSISQGEMKLTMNKFQKIKTQILGHSHGIHLTWIHNVQLQKFFTAL